MIRIMRFTFSLDMKVYGSADVRFPLFSFMKPSSFLYYSLSDCFIPYNGSSNLQIFTIYSNLQFCFNLFCTNISGCSIYISSCSSPYTEANITSIWCTYISSLTDAANNTRIVSYLATGTKTS